jgi:hypothetical protein
MIGQEQDDLVIRFRSPLTGYNGIKPQFLFPDFFTSSAPTDSVVIYDGLAIDLVDARSRPVHSIEVVPGVAFYAWLQNLVNTNEASLSQIVSGGIHNWFYRLLFYTVVFLPVGILLGLRSVRNWPKNSRLILFIYCLLVVPFLLEMVLVARSGQSVRPLNIVTSVVVLALIAWVAVPAVRRFSGFLRNV